MQYVADLDSLRLVVLDSTRPGEDGGELGAERLAWLDAALDGTADVATVIAMHHPPVMTGIPGIAVHAVLGGEVISHVRHVPEMNPGELIEDGRPMPDPG